MTIQELRNEKNFYKRDNEYLKKKLKEAEKQLEFFKTALQNEVKSNFEKSFKHELQMRKYGINSMPYLSNKHIQGLINVMQGKV